MATEARLNLIQSFTRLDGWVSKGLPKDVNFDPKAEAAKIRSTIEEARSSLTTMMVYAKHVETFNTGLALLDKAPPLVTSDKASKKVIPLPSTASTTVEEKPASSASTEPSIASNILGGVIAVPKFLLVTVPTSFFQWATTPKSTPAEEPDGKKPMPAEVIHAREEVSTPEDTSRFKRTDRPPVGLNNENGNDCFLNAVRQFIYNTPIAEHVLPFLPKADYPRTLKDCEDYHAQTVGIPMGGSRGVRNELLPPRMLNGHQDAHEALMQPLYYVNEKTCPLFSRIEGTRTYDLDSLPRGITYDQFGRESKEYFQIGHHHNHGVNVSTDYSGMLLLPIKTEGKQTLKTLQDVWDHYMNPPLGRVTPTTSVDEFGAVLEDSTMITQDMIDSGRVVRNRHGKYKVLPDQVGESFRFIEAPKHLLFSLKRFTRDGNINTKIGDPVEMDPTFTLDRNHIKNGKAADYQIEAFIVQSGGLSGGHYVSYIFDHKKNQWYRCNDSSVTPISTSDAKAAMRTAYSFYARRIDAPYTSAQRSVTTHAAPPRRDISLMPSKPRTHYGLVDKPPIRAQTTSTTLTGELTFASVNQRDILEGSDSGDAQATGFLAKVLNGEAVTKESLGTLLDENVQTVRIHSTSSRSTQQEEAQNRIAGKFASDIASLVLDYKGCQAAGASPEHLAQFLLSRTKEMIAEYHKEYHLTEPSALSRQLPVLVESHLEGRMNKDQLVTELRSLLRQDKVAAHLSETSPSSEMSKVYPAFQHTFGNPEFPVRETCYLESDSGMRQAILRSILTARKEEFLDTNKTSAVGTVLSCNGSTHAVALVKQEDNTVLYRIFDSQGNQELTGSPHAFIFETTDESEAAKFLEKLVTYLPVEGEISIEDLNRLSSYTFIPSENATSSAWSTLGSSLYNAGAFTVSGVYTVTTAPFRGLAYLGRTLSSSCRSKPKPISHPVEFKTDFSSKESVNCEIVKIRSEVVSIIMGNKVCSASDAARLRKALDKVTPAALKYPEFATTLKDLDHSITNFSRKFSTTSTPITTTRPTTKPVSDPRGLLPFYTGGKANVHGFTLEQILRFNDDEMERHHNFIQWIFPTSRVGVDPQAPLLDRGLITAASSEPAFRKNMLRSFDKMLSYYGLERKGQSVVKAANFTSRQKFWLINGKHNLKRMTRIITSMGDLGLKVEARSFAQCIIGIHEKGEISGLASSASFWKNAMRDHT